MDRRDFVVRALAPLLSFPVLSGCGRSSAAGSTTTPPTGAEAQVLPAAKSGDVFAVLAATPEPSLAGAALASGQKAAVTCYAFSGDVVSSVIPFAPGTSIGTELVPDRLNSMLATRFSDSGSIVNVAGLPTVDTGSFAASAWVRSATHEAMTVLTITEAGKLVLSIQSQKASGIVLTGESPLQADAATQSAIGVTDGDWHHVLVQGKSGKVTVYVEGFPARAYKFGASPLTLANVGLTFGPWIGDIDDVRLYNRTFAEAALPLLVYRWTQVTPAAPYAERDGAGLVPFNGQMWLLGGWNPDYAPVTNSEVWSSVDGANWTLQAVAPWPSRHCAGWAVFDDRIWVVGGDNLSGNYQNDVWSSPDGITWTKVATTTPWADRDLTIVTTLGGQLWLMGGCKVFENSGNVAYNDVYSTTDGRTWVAQQSSAAWSPRGMMLGHVEMASRMWIIGGGTYDLRTYHNDVWSSADGVTWAVSTVAAPWAERQYHSVATFAGKMWVIGGATEASSGGTSDVWYSPNGALWLQLPATPWPARHAASVCTHNGVLWLTCGSNTAAFNDVWQLNYAP